MHVDLANRSSRRRPTTLSEQHANGTKDDTLDKNRPSQQQRESHTLGAAVELAERPLTLRFLPEDAETGDEGGSTARSSGIDGGSLASPARQNAGLPFASLQPLRPFPGELLKDRFVLQFDGGSKGNPGNSGAGAVIYRCDFFLENLVIGLVYSVIVQMPAHMLNEKAKIVRVSRFHPIVKVLRCSPS